jgi:hypothetical protein
MDKKNRLIWKAANIAFREATKINPTLGKWVGKVDAKNWREAHIAAEAAAKANTTCSYPHFAAENAAEAAIKTAYAVNAAKLPPNNIWGTHALDAAKAVIRTAFNVDFVFADWTMADDDEIFTTSRQRVWIELRDIASEFLTLTLTGETP